MIFKQHDLAVRIQALTLVEEGITVKRVVEITAVKILVGSLVKDVLI
jgi:hypothetical protein